MFGASEVNQVSEADRAEPGRTERALCQKQVDALLSSVPEIRGALVSAVDGFDVAANLRPPLSAAKMAAMTSSLLALGDAVSSESGQGGCQNVVIESDHGRILMMDIPNRHRKLLLTVLIGGEITLGQVLWAARQCAEETGRMLDGGR